MRRYVSSAHGLGEPPIAPLIGFILSQVIVVTLCFGLPKAIRSWNWFNSVFVLAVKNFLQRVPSLNFGHVVSAVTNLFEVSSLLFNAPQQTVAGKPR